MAPPADAITFRWLTSARMVDSVTREQMVTCWRDVSNAGGAVGFPFPPVDDSQVRPAVDGLVSSLDEGLNRVLVGLFGENLAGWLLLARNSSEVNRHWAKVLRVQTAVAYRHRGIGRAMMAEVARAARDDLDLEQLHLELRGGMGLEAFYRSCGWTEVGAWPAALRLGEADYRDEVLMALPLR